MDETFIPDDLGAMPATVSFSPLLPSATTGTTGNIFAVVSNNAGSDSNALAIFTVLPQLTAGHYFTNTVLVPTGPYFHMPIDAEFSPLINGHLYVAVINTGSALMGVDHTPVSISTGLSNTLSVFEVNQSTGQVLSILSPSPLSTGEVAGGEGVRTVAWSPILPGNKILIAVTNEGVQFSTGSIAIFVLDANVNTFSFVGTFAAGINPIGVSFFSPVPAIRSSYETSYAGPNLYLAVTNSDQFSTESPGSSVWTYRVDVLSTLGALTLLAEYPLTGLNPNVITFSPPLCGGQLSLALVANYGDPTFAGEGLTVYQANSVTGALTLLRQLFPTAPMGQPDGAAFSPLLLSSAADDKLFAAAVNLNTNGINGVNTYLVTLPPTITLAALRGKEGLY